MSTVRISYGCPVRSTCPGNPQVWDAQPKSGAAGNSQAKAEVQKAVGSYCSKQKFKTTHHPPSSKVGQKNPCIILDVDKLAKETFELTGFRLTTAQMEAFASYRQLLLDWNTIHNLTAIREPQEVRTKHFLDSISCILAIRGNSPGKLVDVGTGAGFPGLVLKILYPQMKLTLVESVGKKLDFCRLVVNKLDLEGVTFLNQRVEEVGQSPGHREQYDWAVARAVAGLPTLAEYLLPLVRLGGSMLAMKGETAPAEAHAADYAITVLGGHLRRLLPITLPGVVEQRYLVLIDKIARTPQAYPRRTGVPSKRPLEEKSQSEATGG